MRIFAMMMEKNKVSRKEERRKPESLICFMWINKWEWLNLAFFINRTREANGVCSRGDAINWMSMKREAFGLSGWDERKVEIDTFRLVACLVWLSQAFSLPSKTPSRATTITQKTLMLIIEALSRSLCNLSGGSTIVVTSFVDPIQTRLHIN